MKQCSILCEERINNQFLPAKGAGGSEGQGSHGLLPDQAPGSWDKGPVLIAPWRARTNKHFHQARAPGDLASAHTYLC